MGDLQKLEFKRASVKRQLKAYFNFVNTCEQDLSQLEERYERIPEAWKTFQELQLEMDALYQIADDEKGFEEHVKNGDTYVNLYYEAMAKARNKISEWKQGSYRSSTLDQNLAINRANNVLKVKLPPLTIQPFNGNYDQWLSFKDSFVKAVHEQEDLPAIQKFQILRGLLKDDALKLISALAATEDNYQAAWELLENRYSNIRLITNTHMKGLFEIEPISKSNQVNLRQMVDKIRMHTRSLQSLEHPVHQWDTILIYLINSKLDYATKEDWERELTNEEDTMPTMEDFLKFLEKRCLILEMTDRSRQKTDTSFSTFSNKKEKRISLTSTSQGEGCTYCKKAYSIYKCESFLRLSTLEKYNEVRRMGLCINCLRSGHVKRECKSSACKKCNLQHNTLLHKEYQGSSQTGSSKQQQNTEVQLATGSQQQNSTKEPQVVTHCVPMTSKVMLSTAEVYVKDSEGKEHKCRALLDPGSQSNMITEELARRLNIKSKQIKLPVSGVNQAKLYVRKAAHITIKSTVSRFAVEQEYLIIPSITENLPQVSINWKLLQVPRGIELADPDFNKFRPINMLMGAGIFWKILCPGENVSVKGQPTFQRTALGWIVGGEYFAQKDKTNHQVCHLVTNLSLNEQLERFWKTEELNISEKECKQQDECETQFMETHTRLEDGRFQVQLPKKGDVILGDSFEEAVRRLKCLERRFKREPVLKMEYIKFLREYEAEKHMTLLQEQSYTGPDTYYLPHQAVVKKSSVTTKVRVVFDASSKTTMGTSLNDKLLPGPNLQNDLLNILLRFRCHEYVLTADIKQMYRQVRVEERDRSLQKILWRENPEEPIRIFVLNTITYGTACAPFLAMRCLRQLAREAQSTSPKISFILEEDFYMDDLLTGTASIQEAIALQIQLSRLLETGKFHLRKWRSNDSQIFQHLTSEQNEELLILDRESEKTLGLLWNSREDTLQYRLHVLENNKVSKRLILSTIAKIYDPLGIIGPVLITAKLFLQELWKLQLNWDDEVPVLLKSKWHSYVQSLAHIATLKICRNVKPKNESQRIVLHGFCDASEKAFGACIYVTSKNSFSKNQTHLLCSKSKVAPLKAMTLPRLELSAALLLSRLVTIVKNALKLNIVQTNLWSDSTITLCWIATPPRNLKTFVSNRVAEIQELTYEAEWRHVPSKSNPADPLSRGVNAEELATLSIWWHGPQWIHEQEQWPTQVNPNIKEIPEQKTIITLTTCSIAPSLLQRFSSFTKFQRVIAFCLRYIHNLKKGTKSYGALSVEELRAARWIILKWLQEESFPQDLVLLRSGKPVHNKSSLLMLKPFLDENGLIRVGGRLRNADIPEEQKHPIILPSKQHLTEVIIREEHVKLLHCGPQQLIYSIRKHYWPLSGVREVRKVTRSCVSCFKYRPKVPDLMMADLPSPRVNVSIHPFETTGCDYAGPFQIRESRKRGRIPVSKGYVSVFTCFSTKAVHFELVSDLTTESFLAALRRFAARRGCCSVMYSDNATNFVGAANELQDVFKFLTTNQALIQSELATRGITWKFIPPRSPHFGELWESAVKSMKKHLLTVTKGIAYTYEEYYTLLTEIESLLNSRPLMLMSSDPSDLSALTPSHFLIGTMLLEPPAKLYLDVPDNQLSRWKHLQKLKQHFWKRWKSEYLHHLQSRTKWASGSSNVQIGSMVVSGLLAA